MTPEALKAIMKKNKLDRMELAELTGFDPVTIWRYMNGSLEISEKNARFIKLAIASRNQ
jgi:transcriptional regulator with XRE-family HTH domain